MQEDFDIKLALRVTDKIFSHGTRQGDNYQFAGFTAWTDFDGYTITLSDENVKLNIYFHNKYEFDSDKGKRTGRVY